MTVPWFPLVAATLTAGDKRRLEKKQAAGRQPMPRPLLDTGGRDSRGNVSAPAVSAVPLASGTDEGAA